MKQSHPHPPKWAPVQVRPAVQPASGQSLLLRKCACGRTTDASGECESCRPKGPGMFRGAAVANAHTSLAPPIVQDVLQSPGQALGVDIRAPMELRFGHDFSQVRVHADVQAVRSAQAVNALAYTVGHEVVFGLGMYSPGSPAGRRLLAHELAHVVQQRGQPITSPAALRIGGVSDPAEAAADRAANRVLSGGTAVPVGNSAVVLRRQPRMATMDDYDREGETITDILRVLREELLGLLHSHDNLRFFERVRSLSRHEGIFLGLDEEFMRALRELLPNRLFWSVRLALRFGHDLPPYVARLRAAVYARDVDRIVDLIRYHPELGDEDSVPGVSQMLAGEFPGGPDFDAILRVTASSHHRGSYSEAHYETDRETGREYLARRTGASSFTLNRTPGELHVYVRIRFVRPDPDSPGESCSPSLEGYDLPESTLSRWRTGIEETWNNRFSAFNGTTRLSIFFMPVFDNRMGARQDFVVVVVDDPGFTRSNQECWEADLSGRDAAHEFGHMIGNPDEYRLPGQVAEIPSTVCERPGVGCGPLTAEQELRSSVEGIEHIERPPVPGGYDLPTIMGSGSLPEQRHFWPILDFYNAQMRPADEAPYRLEPVR